MSKHDDIQVYIKWLDMLVSDLPTFIDYLEDNHANKESDFWNDFHSAKIETTRYDELNFYCGMSRGVFVSDNCDYAIKFALNARGEEDCRREVATYQTAIKEGLDSMFASVEYGFTYHGKSFYICERADADEDHAIELSASYSGREREDIEDNDEEAINDIFYSYYDYKLVNKFLDFCYDNHINDIHLNNIGFNGDAVKCIDYAGY